MPELQIIGTPHSNFTWTTRIVCVEKGVPCNFVAQRPHTPEVKSISPFGLIPVLRHGDVQLFESESDMHVYRPGIPGAFTCSG